MKKKKIYRKVSMTAIVISVLFIGSISVLSAGINTNPEQIVIKPEPLGKMRPIFVKLQKEKIRFGYDNTGIFRRSDEPKFPDLPPSAIDAGKYRFDNLRQISEAGLNGVTLLFGGWKRGPAEEIAGEFPRFEPYLRLLAEGCRRHNLYLLASIQYGQFCKSYRRFYDGAGKEAKQAVCPRSWNYWREEMLKRSLIIAKVSLEYPHVLLGVNLDFEMYISDFTNYSGRCMCDVCFGDFMKEFAPGVDWEKIPKEQRRGWLRFNDLMPLYSRYMKREIYNIATKIEKTVHKINPDFVFTYFPGFEWFPGITRGLGTPEQPVVVFSEKEYRPGFSPAIAKRKQMIQKEGYPALYCPAIWLAQHNPKTIPRNLYQMALASDGYWLFTLRSLRGKNSKKGDYVLYKGSTRKQYWDAFRSANTAIEGYKKKGASYCPPFRLK